MREYRIYMEDNPEIAIAYLYADKIEESEISWKFFIGSTIIACVWKSKAKVWPA